MDPIPIPTNLSVMTIDACCQRVQDVLESADLHYGHGASDAQSEALWIVSKQ
jgi:ribosomal protein L3 glutamine methyltransferase